jgi:hypothetical protein
MVWDMALVLIISGVCGTGAIGNSTDQEDHLGEHERRLVSVDELHPSGFMTSSYVLDANTSRKPSKVVETDLGGTVVGCAREPVRRLRPVVSLRMTSNVG